MFVFLLSKDSKKSPTLLEVIIWGPWKTHLPWSRGPHGSKEARGVVLPDIKYTWRNPQVCLTHSKPGMDLITYHDNARIRDSQESFLTKSGLDSDMADDPRVPTNRQALSCAPWHSSSSCSPTMPQGGSFYLTHEETKAQEAQRHLRANSWQIQKGGSRPSDSNSTAIPRCRVASGCGHWRAKSGKLDWPKSWGPGSERFVGSTQISTPSRVLPRSTLREGKYF